MLRNRLYRSPGIDGIRLALVIIEAFTPSVLWFMVVIKTRLRKLTPVLTAAIIIRIIVWSDHAAERSLI